VAETKISAGAKSGSGGKTSAWHRRTKFLVVVDDTPEARVALRYASFRARNVGGGVMLFRAIAPADSQHFLAVEEIMAQEAIEVGQTLLSDLAAQVTADSGIVPELAIREGHTLNELLALIGSDPDIRILVLAAAPGNQGPGPLVSALAGQMSGGLRIPITVVPGSLTDAQIEELT
jgi:nucleotide-binding universal stress UspA family protein